MNKCKTCNVSVYPSETHCPLCHAKMGPTAPSVVQYPRYEDLIKVKSLLRSVIGFIAAATVILCVYIDLFADARAIIVWPTITAAAVLYFLCMFWVIKTKRKRYGAKVVYSYVFLSAFVITIDFMTERFLGSTDFIFPSLTVVAILYLTILALRSKRLFSEYFGYMLGVITIGFLSVPIYFLGLNTYVWGAFMAPVFAAMVAIVLYLFADKTLKEEIHKRFHR